jgi:hypothetical protein
MYGRTDLHLCDEDTSLSERGVFGQNSQTAQFAAVLWTAVCRIPRFIVVNLSALTAYSCPCFVADCRSPRITALTFQNITVNVFPIGTGEPDSHFETLLSVGLGLEVSLLKGEMRFVQSVSGESWNCELFETTWIQAAGRITESEVKPI